MHIRLFLCLLGFSLLAPIASAQFEGWYQIEVLVFERTGGFDDELWPTEISLRYPLHWQELRDPEAIETEANAAAEAATETPVEYTETTLLSTQAEPLAPTPPDLARDAFYTLPNAQRALNRERQRLAAQGNIRVLFHEAWRQPLASAEKTPAVLVFGGETFAKHHRLEGSLQFSVARYLHLQTNLWLSDFHINTGQGSPWPEIPLNPLERLKHTEQTPSDLFAENSNLMGNNWSASRQSAWQTSSDNAELQEFLTAPYLPRRILTVQQHRRMRSGELHYIDHPRVGILLIIHPYKVPPPAPSETGLLTEG